MNFNLHEVAVKVKPPLDPVAAKIWHLLRAGFPQQDIRGAIDLFKEVPWSTQGVERSHGSLASLHKVHPQYSLATLAVRATLHQCRAFFSQSEETKAKQKHQEQMAKLHRSLARSLSARNVFLAELASTVPLHSASSQGQPSNAQDLVRLSHKLYEQLDDMAKLQYEAKAAEATSARQVSLLQAQDALTQSFVLQTQRQRDEQGTVGVLNTLSSCRLQTSDYQALVGLLSQGGLAGAALKALRARALEAPQEPSQAVKLVFQEASAEAVEQATATPAQPDWVKIVCRHREVFHHALFLRKCPFEELHEGFLLLVAIQSPLKAVFLRVQLYHPILNCQRSAPSFGADLVHEAPYLWEFHYSSLDCVSSADLSLSMDADDIVMLQNLQFIGEGRLVTDQKAYLLSAVLATMPKTAKNQSSYEPKEHKHRKRTAEAHLSEYPWLEGYVHERQKAPRAPGPSAAQPSTLGSRPEAGQPAQPELDLEEVWEQLEEKRAEWTDSTGSESFYLQVRGGAWTAANRHVAFDSLMAAAKSGVAADWAKAFHMGQVVTFSFNLYAEDAAYKMAEAWIRKCQHFFTLALEKGNFHTAYTAEDLNGYTDTEFTDWLASLPPASATAKRAGKIHALMPRLA